MGLRESIISGCGISADGVAQLSVAENGLHWDGPGMVLKGHHTWKPRGSRVRLLGHPFAWDLRLFFARKASCHWVKDSKGKRRSGLNSLGCSKWRVGQSLSRISIGEAPLHSPREG